MNNEHVLPADTYTVINKSIITEYDKKIITMLYQPIIGINSCNLYFLLINDLDKNEMISEEENHHHIINSMRISLSEVVIAREKLEAIGLLKTYYKQDKTGNNYVYELFSPLKPNEYFSHPILNIVLFNNVGKKEYEKLVNYFKMPKVKLSDYEDVTKSFDEVFESISGTYFENNLLDIKRENKSDIIVSNIIDIDMLISSFSKDSINKSAFTKDIKDLIIKLSFVYKLDEEEMKNIIINSLNDKLLIDKIELRKNARNYYQFENSAKLPTLVYRSSPKGISSSMGSSKRDKMIYTFETVSPYDFLKSKYNGAKPTARDISLIESLMIDTNLRYPVVNVLIDYVMKINDKKLSKNFVETIAGQWKRLKIETAIDAMNQAEKEYKKNKKIKEEKTKTTTKKEASVPEWFNKDITKTEITKDDENELKDMLKEFK